MARVSTAMSHRIFSGSGGHGKKLSGSRSTQVMPMQPVGGQGRGGDTSNAAINGGDAAGLAASSSENSFLAPASGKQPVPAAPSTATTAIVGFGDAADGDAELEARPSVACDVESSEDEDEASAGRRRQPRELPGDRARSRRRGERAEWMSKVAPSRDAAAFDDDDDPSRAGSDPVRVMALTTSVSAQRLRQRRDRDDDDEEEEEEVAAPTLTVLKGFFSRTPSVGVEIRDQQRCARREAHYRRIRERQDQLRGRLDREDARTADEAVSDGDRRRLTAQQLRRLNMARRLELRREAAAARDHILTRVRKQDERAFSSARELWEREFQDEIRALSDAFRRARARHHCTKSESDAGGEESGRPVTVAGLAVPEALSEIHRGLRNFDKRVKSAGDSPSPTRVKAADAARLPRQSVYG